MTREEAVIILANLKQYISGGGAIDRATNKAIDMAIKALEKPEPHWIPVAERLPEEEGEYLVTSVYQYYRDGRKTYKTTVDRWSRNGAGKEWVATSNDAHIAWMPMPAPLEEEVTE